MVSEIFELKKFTIKYLGYPSEKRNFQNQNLQDLSLITHTYKVIFNELFGIGDTQKEQYKATEKSLSLLLCFFYSPSMLAGGRMSSGLRNELASLFLRLNALPQFLISVWGSSFAYQHYKRLPG